MIKADKLTKRYQNHLAVDNLSLDVRAGEIYGFLGPNGAGKTTTIHMLLGLTPPSSGRLLVFGEEVRPGDFAFKRQIGVVAEEPVEASRMSAWELVRFFAGLYAVARPERRMEELFHALNLWDVRHGLARDYSRGMRQKLSLIRALIHEPRLLILDEPVSGLDPHGIKQVREMIETYQQTGGTVFISSHILSEIEHSANRIGILHGGRLLVEDTMDGLRQRLATQQRMQIELDEVTPELIAQLERQPFIAQVSQQGKQLTLMLRSNEDVRADLSRLISEAGRLILRMQSDKMSLEEAFVTITSQDVLRLAEQARNP